MPIVLAFATSRAGLLAIAFTAIILFYEGFPLGPLRWIPGGGPVLEEIADGRVDRARRDAATDLVQRVELAAAQAQAAELQRQVDAGQRVIENFEQQLAIARRVAADEDARQEQEIADNEKKLAAAGRSCLLDSDDLDWLRKP